MGPEPAAHGGRCGPLVWASCASAYPGEVRSGDGFLIEETDAGVFVGVVDGLGHGDKAADVKDLALDALRRTAGQPLVACIAGCHLALRGSRGVVMTLAELGGDGQLRWLAVGNVDAGVVRHDTAAGRTGRWSVPLRPGVVGDRLPPLREAVVELRAGDLLVAATDGLSPAFLDSIDPSLEPDVVARALHRRHATGNDDALVLVARHAGPDHGDTSAQSLTTCRASVSTSPSASS